MAKGRDAGPVKSGLIVEVGEGRWFSPGNVGIRFRLIFDGGGRS